MLTSAPAPERCSRWAADARSRTRATRPLPSVTRPNSPAASSANATTRRAGTVWFEGIPADGSAGSAGPDRRARHRSNGHLGQPTGRQADLVEEVGTERQLCVAEPVDRDHRGGHRRSDPDGLAGNGG